jgi:hypothetical protein
MSMGHTNSKRRIARTTVAGALLVCALRCVGAIGAEPATGDGLRRIEGRYLTLITDLPTSDEIERLPGLFDQAVPQWVDYFGVEPDRLEGWRLTGHLIKDRNVFDRAKLLPDRLPTFDHGYSIDYQFWLYDQESDYYRRHLLLHEGAHSFMNTLLGGCGPPWYMEGIAEHLATHRIVDGKLQTRWFPTDRDAVPLWGRVRLVQDAVAAGKRLDIGQVMAIHPGGDRTNLGYAWTWALAAFLDGHPRYQQAFRKLGRSAAHAGFDERFEAVYAAERSELDLEWSMFADQIDYGYDLQRAAIFFDPPVAPTTAGKKQVTIAVDRGWQSTGIRLAPGQTYELRASGQFSVAQEPRPWISEAQGVSIHFYRGRPLGMLLMAIRPDEVGADGDKLFLAPVAVGAGMRIRPSKGGVVYLKINDSPAKLADNQGALTIEIGQP